MRTILKFKTENEFIPKDYRRVLISFLKKSLSEIADGKYYEKYYSLSTRRPFTFAVKLPNPTFLNDKIKLEKNEFQLTFSTGDNITGFIFMSAFIAQKGKTFNAPMGNKFVLTNVTKVNEPTVLSNSALVKMQSPLCLREHNKNDNKDTYVSVTSKDFQEKAKQILQEQLLNDGFSENLITNLEILPINTKKTVILHYGCAIECSLGDFVINADKAVINYFFKNGIGSRKSSGFGCISLISSVE